jgi:hypothetical protein
MLVIGHSGADNNLLSERWSVADCFAKLGLLQVSRDITSKEHRDGIGKEMRHIGVLFKDLVFNHPRAGSKAYLYCSTKCLRSLKVIARLLKQHACDIATKPELPPFCLHSLIYMVNAVTSSVELEISSSK